jgi:serine/threonine protein kinase
MSVTPRGLQSLAEFPSEFEEVIEQFEQSWIKGARPRIEEYLPKNDSRSAVLIELLVAELEFRLKAGENARLEDYLPRFPELDQDRAVKTGLACEEFRLRRKCKEAISATEFALRHPDLAPELERELRTDPLVACSPLAAKGLAPGRIEAELGAQLDDMKWLAKGGMGEVWIARDATLRRRVAMKVIQQKHERNAEALRRFIGEAEITSRLEHPGIAPVYGLGEHADGRPCYAMRFVRGESMGDAVKRFFRSDNASVESKLTSVSQTDHPVDASSLPHRLRLHRADRNLVFRGLLQRLISVCQTVAYAHAQGVLHRDVKPENICLGHHGETILLDWGLAKRLEDDSVEATDPQSEVESSLDSAKSKAGSLYGTPQFMSPEQARRDGHPLTPAADIYGLGATLYYVLTGHAPFPRQSPAKVIERVIGGDFPAPRQICKDAPPALEAICLKAMHCQPQFRYGTAMEMANDLERYLADEPTGVYRGTALTSLRRWIRRHGALAAVGATTTIALVGLLMVWTFLSSRHAGDLERKNGELYAAKELVDLALDKQTSLSNELASKNQELEIASAAAHRAANEAREQRDAADRRSEQVLGLTRSLVEMVSISSPEGLRVDPQAKWSATPLNQFSAHAYLDRVIEQVNEKFPADAPARGEVLAAIGQTKRGMGLFESAEPVLTEALRIRRLHAGADDPAGAMIEFNLAWCLAEIQDRDAEAVQRFRNVIRIRKAQVPRDEIALGLAQAGLLFTLYVQGKSQLQLLVEMGPELGSLGNTDKVNIAQIYLNFRAAEDARTKRNWKEGDRLYNLVNADVAKLVPEGHPVRGASDFMMAGYMRDRGDMRAAEEFAIRGMKIYRERVGTHTYMCDPLHHIARYREQIGDYDEAESLHREAYWLAGLNPHTQRNFRHQTTHGLINFLNNVGKHEEVLTLIEKELNTLGAVDAHNASELKAKRIWAWMESGRFAAAVSELKANTEGNRFLPNRASVLTRALFEAGNYDEARAIMPIESHLSYDEVIPRPAPTFEDQLRRLALEDRRTYEEIAAGLAVEPEARDHVGTVGVLVQLARKQMGLRNFDAAGENLREAMSIAKKRMSTIDRAFVDLIVDQALLHLAAGETNTAVSEARRAMDAVAMRYPQDSIIAADYLHQAGQIAKYAGDFELARTYLDKAIKIRSKRWIGVNHRIWFPVLDRIEATPDPAERAAFIRDQLRKMSIQGVSAWRIAVLSRELGATERRLGELDLAQRSLQEASRVFLPMLGENHELSKATATELALVSEALSSRE